MDVTIQPKLSTTHLFRSYPSQAARLIRRLGQGNFNGAAASAVDRSLARGLAIETRPSEEGIPSTGHEEFLTALVGSPFDNSKTAKYPELVRWLKPSPDLPLRAQLLDRARKIHKLVQTVDAPLYHEIESAFLSDVKGARVLMIGRATDGMLYWIHSGLRKEPFPGVTPADFEQLDVRTSLLHVRSPRADLREAKQRSARAKIAELLSVEGYDPTDILREGRRVVLFDVGRRGTNPRALKLALLEKYARTATLEQVRKLDQLIDVRMIWSEVEEGTHAWQVEQLGKLELDRENMEQLVMNRPIPGYVDVASGRTWDVLFSIDTRPHSSRAQVEFYHTRSGKPAIRAVGPTQFDYGHMRRRVPRPSTPALAEASGRWHQHDLLRALEAELFALALMDVRAKSPRGDITKRDPNAGMVRSAELRDYLARHPQSQRELVSELRDLYEHRVLNGSRRANRYSVGELRQIHRATEDEFFRVHPPAE